jgi:cellulose synthase (UDP-forming)
MPEPPDEDGEGGRPPGEPAGQPVAGAKAVAEHPSRDRLNLRAGFAYITLAETPCPATPRTGQPVTFRHVVPIRARATLTLLALLTIATGLAFTGWMLLPAHVPGPGVIGFGRWELTVSRASLCLVVALELVRLAQTMALWAFALKAKDPVRMEAPTDLRAALVTIIPPSLERTDLAERALQGLADMVYRGPVDTWVIDEGDDPTVKVLADRLGFVYFSGQRSWRADHEHRYDVVVRIDPDHVPLPSFLERTLGYFNDPDVAFVVARLLVGSNHLYRPAACGQLDADADPVVESVAATTNPRTGERWKVVHVPDVTTVGEGCMSWADYVAQRKRDKATPSGLPPRRPALYRLIRRHRRNLALGLLVSHVAAATYVLFGITSAELDARMWFTLWGANLTSWSLLWLWLRRYRIAGDETDKDTGGTRSASAPMPAQAPAGSAAVPTC